MKDEEESKKEAETKSSLNANNLAALEVLNEKKEEEKDLKEEPQLTEMKSVMTE